jgi:hypothetical protein
VAEEKPGVVLFQARPQKFHWPAAGPATTVAA